MLTTDKRTKNRKAINPRLHVVENARSDEDRGLNVNYEKGLLFWVYKKN